MKDENDLALARWRAVVREAHGALDALQREGQLDALWLAYHRISNACEKAKARLNEIKYGWRQL